jgi:tetratricopeptide (TPR) repeat protein
MAKLTTEQTMLRAKSHEKKGEVDQALLLYKTIIDIFPNNKRAQQALASLNQPKPVVSNKGTNPPQNQLEALFSLYNKGQLSAALEKAQLLVVGYPSSSIVWNILGATNSDLKKLTEAELCLKKAIELSPNDAGSHYGMGIILHEQGKFDDAIEAYRRALNIKPDYADAHSRMGITLRDQGKLEAAIEVYQLALSILPNSAEIHNGMGIALAKQSKIDAAIEAYQRALKIKSDYAEAHNNMGIAIKDQGKFEDAIAAYQRALKIKPNYDKAHYNMGIALKEQGKLDEAMEAYKCALKIKPDYADALFGLALILNLKGDLINGFELYEWRISDKELKIRKPRAHLSWDGTQNISGKRNVSSNFIASFPFEDFG